ncbi:histidine kinase dimerization/phospho-acceptor domain-containing protein [Nocardia sp. NPDC059240]|uniref:histidine kinase dimerization/phospho-acceptor domain-containing protein n=1 Tax=Nocardia sp. NPDC059240 TaxID=3346786 RepID=UPI0036BC4211
MRPIRVLAVGVSTVPLRVGLVVALVLLSAMALLASGIGVHGALNRSLTDRVDAQLDEAARTWAVPRPASEQVPEDDRAQPRRFFEMRRTPAGAVYLELPGGSDPSDIPAATTATTDVPTTTGSANHTGAGWRVLTVTNEFGSTTIGLSLADNRETLSRLVYLEFAIGATALLTFGTLGHFVIRRSLRPLRAAERTATLEQIHHDAAAIEAAQAEVQRTEEKMRRFIADASHELRTPLTTIRGFAELYRLGGTQNPDLVMTRIEAEANRLSTLVDDLLTLARLDAEHPPIRDPRYHRTP